MTAINPLANPKGVQLVCELCGKVARLQCQFCKVTYYCSKEHQQTDWNGIHLKICQLVVPLRTQPAVLGSEEERMRRDRKMRKSQAQLLELCKTEAQKHLHEGGHELAIPAALQSLRFAIDLHGAGSIELVSSYLLLGEASIGLGRFKQAEEYLSLGKYAVLKKPDCSHALRSHLHRNFGKLYLSQGRYADALQQLANDIYFCSLQNGPEHVTTAGGYFQMGNVFAAQEHQANTLAMYEKVIEIWYRMLDSAVIALERDGIENIDEALVAECLQMLMKILSHRETHLGSIHPATAESYHILGLLFRYMKNYGRAREYTERSLTLFTDALGNDHQSTAIVRKSVEWFDQQPFLQNPEDQ